MNKGSRGLRVDLIYKEFAPTKRDDKQIIYGIYYKQGDNLYLPKLVSQLNAVKLFFSSTHKR